MFKVNITPVLGEEIFPLKIHLEYGTPVLGEENFPLKIHLEYGGTFTKLFMHVSSLNMFPTTRNLQIRVHVFRPRLLNFRLFCSDDCRSLYLVKKSFGPMIADQEKINGCVRFAFQLSPFLKPGYQK